MESKTPLVFELKKKLARYFEAHDLDPSKDYTKDKEHGPFISDLLFKLNRERDKLQTDRIYEDIHSKYKKLLMAKEKKEKKALAQDLKKKKGTDVKSKAEDLKKKAVKEDSKAAKKEAKATVNRTQKYDYPLVDGKPMTSDQKKKYRAEQRRLAKGEAPKPKKEKETKTKNTTAITDDKKGKAVKKTAKVLKKSAKKEED